jgi:hypothetical protein
MHDLQTLVKRLAIGICAAMLGFAAVGGGAAIATGALTSGNQAVIQPASGASAGPSPVYPTNANGQTYGSELSSTSSATDPDLVEVIATNGKTGYAYSSQLNPPAPPSPAAAASQEAANTAGDYIPVYAQDGITVIGEFEVAMPGTAAG